ncbi:MAG TPA: helix-turn-helix transcriptional regulator [Thermoanaerobaculia bacterium]|nr:helix-turn-helix transcriptional regulator [Thermoanaerobaculia bacterium]
MPAGEMSVALAVLRVVRGWNQDDLAKASGVRNSAVSDYERGRKVPELRTLERLVSAMGYPLAAIDQVRMFIEALRSGNRLFDSTLLMPPAVERSGDGQTQAPNATAPLQWEVEQVSAEVGRAVSRMIRVMFALTAAAHVEVAETNPRARGRD